MFRLTRVKESRRLTFWGWLLLTVLLVVAGYIWAITIHDFLAPDKPVIASIWVIEGYVSDAVIDSVIIKSQNNPDLLLICAGLPLVKGSLCTEYDNYAEYNAAVLRTKGLDSMRIVVASSKSANRERTYTTAISVKVKLKELGYDSGNMNVVCGGTHGRRSWLLYRKAMNPEWEVGVISVFDDFYDPKAWWRTSDGVRGVVYEMFAYLYCLLFFHPK